VQTKTFVSSCFERLTDHQTRTPTQLVQVYANTPDFFRTALFQRHSTSLQLQRVLFPVRQKRSIIHLASFRPAIGCSLVMSTNVQRSSPDGLLTGTKRKRAAEQKFYAVRIGSKPGVYHSWADCLEQVKGFKNATCTVHPPILFSTTTNGLTQSSHSPP